MNSKNTDKFISFLKYSLVPNRKKFFVLFANKRIGTAGNYRYLKNKWISKQNNNKLLIIVSGYLLLLLAIYNLFDNYISNCEDPDADNFYITLYNIDMFYYFFNKYFEEFFLFSDVIRDIQISYIMDLYNKMYLIDIYNINCFYYLDFFHVLFNIEDIKYEHDKCLTPIEKWDTIIKMRLDYFDFDFYNYIGFFFGSFCMFEYCIEYNNCDYNIFNSRFFEKYLLYTRKRKKKISIYNHIILSDYYNVSLPYVFFATRTSYILYFRRLRYNYYVRNHKRLDEYTSIKVLYIYNNNGFGNNRYKIPYWRYQKLFSLKHFYEDLPSSDFCNTFNIYNSLSKRRLFYIDNNYLNNYNIFKIVVNYKEWNILYKFKVEENLNLIYDFTYENLLDIIYMNYMNQGFKLLMNFKSVYKFMLVNSTYNDLDEFVNTIYLLPHATLRLYQYLNVKLLYKFCMDIYINSFCQLYFFKDLYNCLSKDYIYYSINLLSFYNKLIYLVLYAIDPQFFYEFYSKCFHRRNGAFFYITIYASHYLTYYLMEDLDKLSDELIENFSLFIFYLKWKLNINHYNDFHNDLYLYSNNIIQFLNKNRIKNIYKRMYFYLNKENLNANFIYNDYKYYNYVKDLYFNLLYEDVEYNILFFFLNKEKFLDLNYRKNNYFYNNLGSYVGSNFIYRYYTFNILMQFNYYEDWYDNRLKFCYWIYYRFKKYEGKSFYRKIDDIL